MVPAPAARGLPARLREHAAERLPWHMVPSLIVAVANLVVDILYVFIDPRIRLD